MPKPRKLKYTTVNNTRMPKARRRAVNTAKPVTLLQAMGKLSLMGM
jgi:hypothetical protein